MTHDIHITNGDMAGRRSAGGQPLGESLLPSYQWPIGKLRFVDLEGNGYWDDRQDIVEISILAVGSSLQDLSLYHSLAHPRHPVSRTASRIHKLSDRELKLQPVIEDLGADIHRRLAGMTWAGHNVRGDYALLSKRIGEIPILGFIDTFALARRLVPGLTSYKLMNLVSTFNLGSSIERILINLAAASRGYQPHSAVYDVVSSFALYDYFRAHFKKVQI